MQRDSREQVVAKSYPNAKQVLFLRVASLWHLSPHEEGLACLITNYENKNYENNK